MLPGQLLANLPRTIVIAHGFFFIFFRDNLEQFYLLSFCPNLFPNSFSSESGQWSCLSLSGNTDELFHQENETKQNKPQKTPTIGLAKWIRKPLKIYMFVTITAKDWLSDWCCQPRGKGVGLVGCFAHVLISFVLLLLTLRYLKRNRHDIYVCTWTLEKVGFLKTG